MNDQTVSEWMDKMMKDEWMKEWQMREQNQSKKEIKW